MKTNKGSKQCNKKIMIRTNMNEITNANRNGKFELGCWFGIIGIYEDFRMFYFETRRKLPVLMKI